MLGGTRLFTGPLVSTIMLQALNHHVMIYTEYHGLVLGSVIPVFVLGLRQVSGLREAPHDKLA